MNSWWTVTMVLDDGSGHSCQQQQIKVETGESRDCVWASLMQVLANVVARRCPGARDVHCKPFEGTRLNPGNGDWSGLVCIFCDARSPVSHPPASHPASQPAAAAPRPGAWQPQIPTGPRKMRVGKAGEAKSLPAVFGGARIPLCNACGTAIRWQRLAEHFY